MPSLALARTQPFDVWELGVNLAIDCFAADAMSYTTPLFEEYRNVGTLGRFDCFLCPFFLHFPASVAWPGFTADYHPVNARQIGPVTGPNNGSIEMNRIAAGTLRRPSIRSK